jgi:hypothetical protein
MRGVSENQLVQINAHMKRPMHAFMWSGGIYHCSSISFPFICNVNHWLLLQSPAQPICIMAHSHLSVTCNLPAISWVSTWLA